MIAGIFLPCTSRSSLVPHPCLFFTLFQPTTESHKPLRWHVSIFKILTQRLHSPSASPKGMSMRAEHQAWGVLCAFLMGYHQNCLAETNPSRIGPYPLDHQTQKSKRSHLLNSKVGTGPLCHHSNSKKLNKQSQGRWEKGIWPGLHSLGQGELSRSY